MIEKLIAFLQWIQSSEKLRHRVDFVFSMLFLFITGIGAYKILAEILFQRDYGYSYYGGYRESGDWLLRSDFTDNGLIFSLILFLLFSLIGVYAYGIYKRIIKQDFSVVGLIVNCGLPIFVGILITAISVLEPSFAKWYILVFGGLYALSACILFLENLIHPSGGFISRFFDLYKKYIIAFLVGFSIFVFLFIVGNLGEFRYMDFSETVLELTMIAIPYALITWLLLTYAWTTLENITESSYKNVLKGGLALAFFFILIWISPDWKTLIIDDRIYKAQNFLGKYGNTEKGYTKAASVWGLKWALKEQYLHQYGEGASLYAKIYDRSIESEIEDEIDVNAYRSWNSNGTNMLARGENAKVELNFAKHESTILSDIGAVETTVTYEFQNTDTQNQEVVYSIELPSSESVVTDLRLGLSLELTGVLAPRGAAEQVYVDSLRRNTDPALLEQTGPTSYRLRVFPVLGLNDPKTQGRQRVQYRYITPLHGEKMVTLIPRTDILNLRLTEKSEIMYRVTEGAKVLIQESEKVDNIEILNAGKNTKLEIETITDSHAFCSINTYGDIDISKFKTAPKNLSRNIVFLDNSKSVGDDKKIQKRYQELIDTWKNAGVALDIYTFNTAVTSLGYDLSDLEYWGNTDMATVISYIASNDLINANIVILTDDASYEIANAEIKTIDYNKLKSNRISLIQIGEKIRTLKSEVTKSILATEGDVMRLTGGEDIDAAIRNLFSPEKLPESCVPYTGTNTGALSAIEGGRDGKKMIGYSFSFTGETRIEKIAYSVYKYSTPSFQSLSNDGEGGPLTRTLIEESILNGEEYEVQNIYASTTGSLLPAWYAKGTGLLTYDHTTSTIIFQIYNNGDLVKEKRMNPEKEYLNALWEKTFYGTGVRMITITGEEFLEKIGTTAHIVNQSMSLIALENDRQRADLERYSNQEDKYDTTYQNFTPDASGRPSMGLSWWGNENVMPMSLGTSGRRGEATQFFGQDKAMGLYAVSDSYSPADDMIFGGGDSTGKLGQIIIVIILFPLAAWYILRRKPKAKAEVSQVEEKKSE